MTAPIRVLLVEDNPGDTDLTKEVLEESPYPVELFDVQDGAQAISFLNREGSFTHAPRPDLVILDLNLPRKNGREVLEEIKRDQNLKIIPVVVLTTSDAETDILTSYQLGANCYVTKPVGFSEFRELLASVNGFWFAIVQLPTANGWNPDGGNGASDLESPPLN